MGSSLHEFLQHLHGNSFYIAVWAVAYLAASVAVCSIGAKWFSIDGHELPKAKYNDKQK